MEKSPGILNIDLEKISKGLVGSREQVLYEDLSKYFRQKSVFAFLFSPAQRNAGPLHGVHTTAMKTPGLAIISISGLIISIVPCIQPTAAKRRG